jgi:hypothetical protein
MPVTWICLAPHEASAVVTFETIAMAMPIDLPNTDRGDKAPMSN